MKKYLRSIIGILLVVALCFGLYKWYAKPQTTSDIQVSHQIVVQQIEQIGRLEVVRYNIQDLVKYEKKRSWLLPDSHIAIKVVGEVTGSVDLTKLEKGDIWVEGDSVSVILPDPEIGTFKIDHSKSKVFDVQYGLWQTADIVDEAYKEAEGNLKKQAYTMGITQESRANAVKLLLPILKALGFRAIHVGFRSTPDYQLPTIQVLQEQ